MTELILVKLIEPNEWNPNVMQEEEYDALKQDMHVHGVDGVDAVLVSPTKVFYKADDNEEGPTSQSYVIVDGEHRWKAAQELGWKEILCEVREITEDDAKALCYRRNRERGTIDPFKEALLFKSDLSKLTQAKIAGKYGVAQTTVSQRLSLLKLDRCVLDAVKNVPRGIIVTPSHLEPIATLTLDDQKIVAKQLKRDLGWGQSPTVKGITGTVQELKKERAAQESIEKALLSAKFPKCPKCGEKPSRVDHQGLPWVHCRSFHTSWNLDTGKKEFDFESDTQKDLAGNSKPVPPKTIRSVHTIKELHKVFIDRIKEVIPTMEVKGVKVDGKLGGQDFSFDITFYGKSMAVSWHRADTWRGFRAEEHDYKSGEKAAVDAGSPDQVEEVKQLIENAFQGKLGIEPKKKKASKKTAAEIIHELHEPLEADHIVVAENSEEGL